MVLNDFIKKQEDPAENVGTKTFDTRDQLKLRKFEIMKFIGKSPIEWTSFYDSPHDALNKNSSLSNV